MRSMTRFHALASARAGSITIARLNVVAQSSSERVTPCRFVSWTFGSGFFATRRRNLAITRPFAWFRGSPQLVVQEADRGRQRLLGVGLVIGAERVFLVAERV